MPILPFFRKVEEHEECGEQGTPPPQTLLPGPMLGRHGCQAGKIIYIYPSHHKEIAWESHQAASSKAPATGLRGSCDSGVKTGTEEILLSAGFHNTFQEGERGGKPGQGGLCKRSFLCWKVARM